MKTTDIKCDADKVQEVPLPMDGKPLPTLGEALIYTGIGINKLRVMSNERTCICVLFAGRKRMFKRETLWKFLNESYSV